MKKLHRYLMKQFVGPFFAVLMVVVFALALEFLWVYIDELVGKGLGLGVIMEFMAWASAILLPLALPLATLLASIMTLGGLGEHNEILAMKAAGISLKRILFPVFILAFVVSVSAFFIANNLVPVAHNKIYTLREDIAKTKDEIKIPTGTFYNGIDGYILRIGSTDDDGTMHNLIIYDHTNYSGNTNMTLAQSGKINVTPDKQNLIFDLYDGCSYQEDNVMTYRDTMIDLSRVAFDYQQVIVPLQNYSFSRSEESRYGDEVMARNLKQLVFDRDSLYRELDTLELQHYKRWLSGSRLTYFRQIDTMFNKTFLDKPLDREMVFANADGKFSGEKEKSMILRCLENFEEISEMVKGFEGQKERYMDHLLKVEVERFRKFTLSIACLLFFFIGAPLGALIRKGGLGTPMVISVFFFLLYYVIDTVGKRLAQTGTVPPFMGAVISSAVLLPIGIFLTRKSTQDSSIFNVDFYKEFFKTVKRKISKAYNRTMNRLFRKGGGKIRIVFMGTPEFAVAQLDALMNSEYEVVAVVTVPDKPSGRGLSMNESAVKKYAVEHNLPVLQPVKLKDPEFLEQLRSFNANLFVVVAFRMLPKEVWSMPALGTFNLHASLLPQYRGAAPINWAIINGERVSGVTTFMIDEQIDTGRILFQESCNIEDYEDAGDLHDKLMKMGCDLVLKTVDAIENRQTKPYEQEAGSRTIKPAPKLTKELCKIDWREDARTIHLLIRGLSPYPAAFGVLVKGEQKTNVKIFETYVVKSGNGGAPAGSITSDGKSFLEVKCGTDSLRIINLQLAGKKRMDIHDFLLGFRDPDSYAFEVS
ncbi:MAG: methionyl-tRNA formyltransferase [Bacteroidales bacterium]|nr:methionyl-tRNA formyltransferase [Candidatus Cacconaster merdequi]